MYSNVYIRCIYIFNLCSKVKFNNRSKENIFMLNHPDMQKGMLRILNYLTNRQYQLTHLYLITCPAAKPQYQIILKALSAVNRPIEFSLQCHVVKTLAVHCHYDVCNAPGGHSAGCRTSWVCL